MSRPQAESAWPPALFGQARVRVPAPGKLAALFEPLVVYLFVVVQRISYRLQSFRNRCVHIKVFLAEFRNKSRGGKKTISGRETHRRPNPVADLPGSRGSGPSRVQWLWSATEAGCIFQKGL